MLLVGYGCFLDILLNLSYLCLSVKIFSCLCSYLWARNFEMHFRERNFVVHPCSELFFEFLFIHYGCFLNGCSFRCKKSLVTDQFNTRLQFWLNLASDILFVKTKETKIRRQFLVFLMLYLHYWYSHTIIYFYNFIFFVLNKTTKCNRAVIILHSNTWW